MRLLKTKRAVLIGAFALSGVVGLGLALATLPSPLPTSGSFSDWGDAPDLESLVAFSPVIVVGESSANRSSIRSAFLLPSMAKPTRASAK